MKKICMFCGRSHKAKPKLCEAREAVITAYRNLYMAALKLEQAKRQNRTSRARVKKGSNHGKT